MANSNLMVVSGNANPLLAKEVARRLQIPVGRIAVGRFSDGEVNVEILENVRGRDVFVLQSTSSPTNDNLMEIMVIVDALKRSSAARITAAIPYFGYARQDRRPRSARVAISAKVVANMLEAVGVDRVLTMDLHAGQIQGFFDIPTVMSGSRISRTSSSYPPTWAAWCVRVRWPSGSTVNWPSSTSVAPRPMCRKS